MNEILKYFPHITEEQRLQFEMLKPLYSEWNSKINVISRKDIDNIYLHHVLHSLAIAKDIRFNDESHILDFGTGGGFPGIPLAIMFPNCHFKLIDRTGKKIKVVNEVAGALNLKNVEAAQIPGEEEKGKYDFVVSRAVMPLPDLIKIIKKNTARRIFLTVLKSFNSKNTNITLCSKIDPNNIYVIFHEFDHWGLNQTLI